MTPQDQGDQLKAIEGNLTVLSVKHDMMKDQIDDLKRIQDKQTDVVEKILVINERQSNMQEDLIDFKKAQEKIGTQRAAFEERGNRYMNGAKLIGILLLALEGLFLVIISDAFTDKKQLTADVHEIKTQIEVMKSHQSTKSNQK